jgi:maltooligosyltrehalose trehalohydrolase
LPHRFTVWAPDAELVELLLCGPPDERRAAPERHPMAPEGGGWWSLTVDDAGPGTDYLYSVDGGPGRPDPRSRWQPYGVEGPSRVLDDEAFEWSDAGWVPPLPGDAVIYEIHVGTFSAEGTFRGAIGHLHELAELGVTHVQMMPVAAFSGRWGWGYDGVDLFAPHPIYGSPDDLKAFVDAAHGHGLAVLLDCVYNHLGPVGNFLRDFGPYFTDKYATPWGEAVNVDDAGSTEVRRFIVDNALMWLRHYRIDGLRLDAVHAIIDTSAVHILEQLSAEVEALGAEVGRRFVLVAESDRNDPRMLQPRSAGGLGIDAHWNDDFHHAVHVALTDEQESYYVDYGGLKPLADALRHAYVYRGQYSEHRERNHGRPAVGLSGHSFVGYVQNHDQIGNRAQGERATHLLGPRRLMIAAAVVMTSPFVPMLFQGEEWAASAPFPYFADHRDDPDLADAVRQGRLDEFAAFGWDPDVVADPEDPATFRSARVDRTERSREPHASLWRWYRDLIALRTAEPSLRDGRFDEVDVAFDDGRGTLAYRHGDIGLALNLGPEIAMVTLPGGLALEVVLASDDRVAATGAEVELPPDTVAVVRAGPGSGVSTSGADA